MTSPRRLLAGFVTAALGYFAARLASKMLGLDNLADDLADRVLAVAPWLYYGGGR